MTWLANHTLSHRGIRVRSGYHGGVQVSLLGLLCGVLLWPVEGSAELYKWTDEEGNFHITDTPPPGLQKKSVTTAVPAPHSTPLKRAKIRPTLPGRPQAEVYPIPNSPSPSPVDEPVPLQSTMEGLSPRQATLTSAWQVFDSSQVNAKAPVQWWKDQQGLDHLADVLPVTKNSVETQGKIEDVSVSHSRGRTKDRATSVTHPRRQTPE